MNNFKKTCYATLALSLMLSNASFAHTDIQLDSQIEEIKAEIKEDRDAVAKEQAADTAKLAKKEVKETAKKDDGSNPAIGGLAIGVGTKAEEEAAEKQKPLPSKYAEFKDGKNVTPSASGSSSDSVIPDGKGAQLGSDKFAQTAVVGKVASRDVSSSMNNTKIGSGASTRVKMQEFTTKSGEKWVKVIPTEGPNKGQPWYTKDADENVRSALFNDSEVATNDPTLQRKFATTRFGENAQQAYSNFRTIGWGQPLENIGVARGKNPQYGTNDPNANRDDLGGSTLASVGLLCKGKDASGMLDCEVAAGGGGMGAQQAQTAPPQ